MPTYQYACTNTECSHRFELVQAFTDDAVTECPVCGERVRKVYGSVGVVFKGTGFYRNDSREGGSEKSEPGSGDTKSGDAAAQGDAKSGEKPATDGKSGDTKIVDGKTGENKSPDNKASDVKSPDKTTNGPSAKPAAGSSAAPSAPKAGASAG